MKNYFFRDDLFNKKPNKIYIENKKINLSLNESSINPLLFFTDKDWDELKSIPIHKYPSDSFIEKVKEQVCIYNHNDVKPDELILANGIDDLLYLLFIAVAQKGSKILYSIPSYPDYANYSASCSLGSESLLLTSDFHLDVEQIIKKGKHKAVKLIIICNPNNPTGNLFKTSDIFYILENIQDTLIAVDEAYFEFNSTTFLPYINNYQNLVILRSFSKGFLVPGLRFGYLSAHRSIIHELRKVKSVFNISALTLAYASKLLSCSPKISDIIEKLKKMRDSFIIYMRNIPEIEVYHSETNFILFRMKTQEVCDSLYKHLLDKDISVRNVSSQPLLHNCLRVSVGDKNENTKFLKELEFFFSKKK